MHLIIDGYGGDPRKMQDVEFISNLLDAYPSQIGMTKIPQRHTIILTGLDIVEKDRYWMIPCSVTVQLRKYKMGYQTVVFNLFIKSLITLCGFNHWCTTYTTQ